MQSQFINRIENSFWLKAPPIDNTDQTGGFLTPSILRWTSLKRHIHIPSRWGTQRWGTNIVTRIIPSRLGTLGDSWAPRDSHWEPHSSPALSRSAVKGLRYRAWSCDVSCQHKPLQFKWTCMYRLICLDAFLRFINLPIYDRKTNIYSIHIIYTYLNVYLYVIGLITIPNWGPILDRIWWLGVLHAMSHNEQPSCLWLVCQDIFLLVGAKSLNA